eukprot:345019_1
MTSSQNVDNTCTQSQPAEIPIQTQQELYNEFKLCISCNLSMQNEFKKTCCDIENCNCIKRLVIIMNWNNHYRSSTIRHNKDFDFISNIFSHTTYCMESLVNDYFHLQTAHKLFEKNTTITTHFKNSIGECNNDTCDSILRNIRRHGRNNNIENGSNIIAFEYIDCMHSYLFHDPATLYRLRELNNEGNNRFTTASKNPKDGANDTDTLNDLDLGNYSTYFWPKAKFSNWKQELLHNEYSPITTNEYDKTIEQCKLLAKSIKNVDNLSVDEISCIKFYTDFDDLCSAFRQAYRSTGELQELNERRSQFKRWAEEFEDLWKYIAVKSNNTVYHGIRCVLGIKNSNIPTYHGPVSTSTSLTVSQIFAGHYGMILHIKDTVEGYDVSWISRYPNEKEFLLVSSEIPLKTCTLLTEVKLDWDYIFNSVASSDGFQDFKEFVSRYNLFSDANHVHQLIQDNIQAISCAQNALNGHSLLEVFAEFYEFDLFEILNENTFVCLRKVIEKETVQKPATAFLANTEKYKSKINDEQWNQVVLDYIKQFTTFDALKTLIARYKVISAAVKSMIRYNVEEIYVSRDNFEGCSIFEAMLETDNFDVNECWNEVSLSYLCKHRMTQTTNLSLTNLISFIETKYKFALDTKQATQIVWRCIKSCCTFNELKEYISGMVSNIIISKIRSKNEEIYQEQPNLQQHCILDVLIETGDLYLDFNDLSLVSMCLNEYIKRRVVQLSLVDFISFLEKYHSVLTAEQLREISNQWESGKGLGFSVMELYSFCNENQSPYQSISIERLFLQIELNQEQNTVEKMKQVSEFFIEQKDLLDNIRHCNESHYMSAMQVTRETLDSRYSIADSLYIADSAFLHWLMHFNKSFKSIIGCDGTSYEKGFTTNRFFSRLFREKGPVYNGALLKINVGEVVNMSEMFLFYDQIILNGTIKVMPYDKVNKIGGRLYIFAKEFELSKHGVIDGDDCNDARLFGYGVYSGGGSVSIVADKVNIKGTITCKATDRKQYIYGGEIQIITDELFVSPTAMLDVRGHENGTTMNCNQQISKGNVQMCYSK